MTATRMNRDRALRESHGGWKPSISGDEQLFLAASSAMETGVLVTVLTSPNP